LHLKHKIKLEVNKIIEQVSSFNFLGNLTSCEKEVKIGKKLNKYLKTTGVSNMLTQHKPLKKTRIKQHNTLALPALLYSSENWTIKARDARRITAAETIYMRKTAGYVWANYKTNTKTAKELILFQFWTKYRNREETVYNKQTGCHVIGAQVL
jgi:hypothetical protein